MARTQRFVQVGEFDCSAEALFDWHAREDAFQDLVPPWEDVRVVARRIPGHAGSPLAVGTRVELSMRVLGPVRVRWVAEHTAIEPGRLFRDEQREGPFAAWVHTHRFEPLAPARARLVDEVAFRLPLDPASRVAMPFVRRGLRRMFAWRHRATGERMGVAYSIPAGQV